MGYEENISSKVKNSLVYIDEAQTDNRMVSLSSLLLYTKNNDLSTQKIKSATAWKEFYEQEKA